MTVVITAVVGDRFHPTLRIPPASIGVDLISPINLTCTADGTPAPTYQWFKDGAQIPGETKEFLYIEEAAPEDRGNYTCVAINRHGRIKSNPARITIPGVLICLTV